MIKEIDILSPGRICLYGDHQDYLGLPVIASAIDKHMNLKAIANKKTCFRIFMPDIKQQRSIFFDDTSSNRRRDYFISAMNVLKRNGYHFNTGYDITITGNIPIRAGASSSSAMVSAWICFLCEVGSSEKNASTKEKAIWTYTAEVLEHNEPGGKMDQFTINIGNIVYINTQEEYDITKLNASMKGLILANSKTEKDTLEMLKRVRGQQEKAISEIKKIDSNFTIKDSDREDYQRFVSKLDPDLHAYFEAAITNYHCTIEALSELKKENPDKELLAKLMNEHHKMLKDNLKITIPIIDVIVDIAIENGAKAAKINGSGGGGSVVIYAEENVKTVLKSLEDRGFEAYEIDIDPGTRVTRKILE